MMSNKSDDPPDRGPNIFRRNTKTIRSPPPATSASSKRLFSEMSPTYISPEDRSKRLQTSESVEKSSPILNISDSVNADYCDLVSEASTYLSKINELVNDQGSRINFANKSSIMDMTQRVTAIISVLAIKSSCNETKLANTERELDKIKLNNCVNTANKKISYADSLKLRLPKVAPAMESRAPLPCIIAYPTTTDNASSSATKQALMKAIKPCDDGFQIVGLKKTAKSGVVLRVANENQLKKLESVDAIRSAGLRLEKPKGRRPRLLVKDVPSSMEDGAFLSALYRQNIKDELPVSEGDFIKSTKIIRRRSLDNGRKWIGIEIESAVRKHLVLTKDKLFIDWATCRFVDDIEVVRCLHCQQFGHVKKYCVNKLPTCANCSEAHETKDCPHKDDLNYTPTCVACKRFKKQYDHRCGSQECTTYKLKLEQLILNTNYNG